jgi:hypothetical protein
MKSNSIRNGTLDLVLVLISTYFRWAEKNEHVGEKFYGTKRSYV